MNLSDIEHDPSLGYPVIFGERPIDMSEQEHASRELLVGIILSEFRRRGSAMSERTGTLLSTYLSGQIDTEELTSTCNALARSVGVVMH